MKQVAKEEIFLRNIAYLEDRVKVHTGQPQVYGTQFKLIDGKFIPDEIEDPQQVDERRKEMCMTTLNENVELMYTNYKVKKPEK